MEQETADANGSNGFSAQLAPGAPQRVWSWTYNEDAQVLTEQDPAGGVTQYAYYAATTQTATRGDLRSVTDSAGRVTSFTRYDPHGNVLEQIAPTGLVTSYTYDQRQRLTSISGDGATFLMTYQPTGQLKTLTQPDGYKITYEYDTAQRLIGWADNRGGTGSYALNAMGKRTQEQILDSAGSTAFALSRTIDSFNRISTETVGGNQTVAYSYNGSSDLVGRTNALSQSTSYTFDNLRRLATEKDPLGTQASLVYDAGDAITRATDFKGVATSYERDARGNAKGETSADAGAQSAQYDTLGLPKQVTDALGRATTITRDALGRPTLLQYADNTSTTLRYDLAGLTYNAPGAPQASIGYLSEVQDAGVTTRYQRDLLGRITRKTQLLANDEGTGSTRSISYTYIPAGQGGAGQIASVTYASGRQLTHQYDATGRLTGMQWNGQPLLANITWNALGQPTGWQWSGFASGPGSSTVLEEIREYTSAGQLAGSALLDLTWDTAGRIRQIKQQHMLPGTAQAQQAVITSAYNYDATGHLTASAHSGPPGLALPSGDSLSDTIGMDSIGYAWDANGNRSQTYYSATTSAGAATLQRVYQGTSGGNQLRSYTETLQLPGSLAQTTSTTYTYDATGALTKKGDSYLHYGVDGRIGKASASADPGNVQAVSYRYNALGQRVIKSDARLSTTSPLTQQTVYDEDGIGSTVLGQYSNRRSATSTAPAGETDTTEIIYLPTASGPMPIAAQINGRLYAIDADHLNTPRRMTNQQGQVVWQWLITGFGEVQPTTAAAGYKHDGQGTAYGEAVAFDLRYPGQQWDAETKLAYNLHRYYDAATGRYIQADPIGLGGGWNRFGYVGGNPLSFVDPVGLQFLDLTTLAGARRNTTLDDAVRAGAWTRAITLPAVTAGLTPSAIGLVGSASAPLFCAAPETITVSRWGREGLETGDWVMKGGQNWWTYARSFKWQPGMGNQFAPYGTGASYQIPASAARWPTGVGIDGAWKGLFGQRIYLP
ncbi:YD repeat protein [Acidovorax delafieldii 2AN]|uniref:YD repeat protein n=1 Tax=Acidovorax delafieldii 2AN TaxID=573060 RepID=C5T0D9_ACIDE|nr:YD repeat protein [Acidovorax delafieldii 2AN]